MITIHPIHKSLFKHLNRPKIVRDKCRLSLLQYEVRKEENLIKTIVRSAKLVTLNPFIQIFARQVWKEFIWQIFVAIPFHPF